MTNILAEKILIIAAKYLGPEAKRFLDRQAKHLKAAVEFDMIKEEQIEELCWWMVVSGKLIMKEDRAKKMADEVFGLLVKM